MASADGNSTDRVTEQLVEDVRQFAFFQLVHLLERSTKGPAIGCQGPVKEERIRFSAEPSLAFPPGDLTRLEYGSPRSGSPKRYELTTTFMGLYGPASPLPAHYTEAVIASDLDNSNRRDFLDFFHQRLLAFLYRIWKKYRYYVNYLPNAEDAFSQRMFALIGGRSPAIRDGVELNWERLLSCSGLVAMVGSSADAVERTVSHYFDGLGTRVEPLVARSIGIEPDQQVLLGQANSTLGGNMTIGRTVRDRSGKFRLILGPMGWTRLNRFLPDQAEFHAVVRLVKLMLTDALAFDLVLLVERSETKRLLIGVDNSCRLGWTTWLGSPQSAILSVRLRTE